MASFARLKRDRTQRQATSSIVTTKSKPHESVGNVDLESAKELVSVNSPTGTDTSLDQSPQLSSTLGLDNLEAFLPSDLNIKSRECQGRGIWTNNRKRAGQILLAESQHAACLSTRFLPSHCSACFLESEAKPLKRCASCKLLYYCDSRKDCQRRDWSVHKRECPALQKWAATAPETTSDKESEESRTIIPSDAIRLLGRSLWTKQKQGLESAWTKAMNAMQSHRASLSAEQSSSELHTHMAHALVRYLGAESIKDLAVYGIGSIPALVDLVSQLTTNAFAVTDPALMPIGVSISPTIALFNHSCEPNAVLVFSRSQHRARKEEPAVEVVAIRDIAADEEVLISYIDSTLPREQRQEALNVTYYFTCDCSLCSKPRQEGTYVDPREENLLTRCVRCGAVVKDTDSVLDAVRIGQEALEKATRLQFSDPKKSMQLTTNLIPILTSAGLLPSSHPLLALSRLHTTLLITNYQSPFESDTIEINSPQIQELPQDDLSGKTRMDDAQEHLDEAISFRTSNSGASSLQSLENCSV
ncbi:hypothetical protein NP233_g11925 [Leucocoprinus birnbaumii]|uniref:SET domain-containing protein n=1 Tax=Leucocoprinus birnbaumii TaxID=56174 RepID=A0AAD5VLA1_9AGAR|nr:hypothetical protein NP233_g11925 [Leucocoprinus birnbaumii]